MIALLLWLRRPLDWWLSASTIERAAALGTEVVGGAALYAIVLLLLGLRPAQFVLERR